MRPIVYRENGGWNPLVRHSFEGLGDLLGGSGIDFLVDSDRISFMMDHRTDILVALNSTLNDGRGVNVLRMAIVYLERGRVDEAKMVLLTDRDKLWQYDGVVERLIQLDLLPPLHAF